MKFYPSTHKIYNVDKVDTSEDIALGYLDSEFIEETIKVNINDEYNSNLIKEVLPYSTVNSLEITLFDKNENSINLDEQEKLFTRQESGKYMYKPRASVVFEPYTFEYKVLAKKDMKYSSSRKYNIRVGCDNKELAKKMIQFFSDSYERNMCPTNIKFNNGNRKLESLFNSSIKDNDFIFIESEDGIYYKNANDIEIPIDELLESNVIPWIICDSISEDEKEHSNQQELEFEIAKNSVMNTESYITNHYFEIPKPKNGEIYHSIFKYHKDVSPIIIKEISNKGFVVYCSSEFMARLASTYDIFYELILYVYLRAYVSTQTITEWIADVMPDYIVQNGRLTQKEKFTSHMELHKLLGLREGDANPIEVKIYPPAGMDTSIVYYTGMSSNYLVFKKMNNTEYADPIKEDHQISIFTERKNIMFYDSFVYSIQESIEDKISCSILNDKLTVTVKPFKNTELDTRNFISTQSVSIDLDAGIDSQDFSLIWDMNKKTVNIIKTNLEENHVLLAAIKTIKEKKDSRLYDMRRRGGGLSEDKDDFNCLDIGNVLGRPYRKGGSLITTIQLPLKYEHRRSEIYEIIYGAIRKHMVADDYLILNLHFE